MTTQCSPSSRPSAAAARCSRSLSRARLLSLCPGLPASALAGGPLLRSLLPWPPRSLLCSLAAGLLRSRLGSLPPAAGSSLARGQEGSLLLSPARPAVGARRCCAESLSRARSRSLSPTLSRALSLSCAVGPRSGLSCRLLPLPSPPRCCPLPALSAADGSPDRRFSTGGSSLLLPYLLLTRGLISSPGGGCTASRLNSMRGRPPLPLLPSCCCCSLSVCCRGSEAP